MSHVKIAVFPVAGLGTRFRPATKAVPKEMLPLVDRPLIDDAVEEARAAGIEQFIFVTSRDKPAIETHYGRVPHLERRLHRAGKTAALQAVQAGILPRGTARFLRQDRPLGLGHAVGLARHLVGDQPFALLLPDDVIMAPRGCLAQMVAAMEVAPDAVRADGILPTESWTSTAAKGRSHSRVVWWKNPNPHRHHRAWPLSGATSWSRRSSRVCRKPGRARAAKFNGSMPSTRMPRRALSRACAFEENASTAARSRATSRRHWPMRCNAPMSAPPSLRPCGATWRMCGQAARCTLNTPPGRRAPSKVSRDLAPPGRAKNCKDTAKTPQRHRPDTDVKPIRSDRPDVPMPLCRRGRFQGTQ